METASTVVVVAVLTIAGEYLADMRTQVRDDLAYASEVWRGIITVAHLAGRDLDAARQMAREHLAGWTPELDGVEVTPALEKALAPIRRHQARWQRVLDTLG